MIEFGKTLRAAREAKGYTISQIAEQTHLLSSVVDGLEREDFSHIPAPIYGRGFVRLYCEAVGLESKPLVAAFMARMINADAPAPDPAAAIPSAPEPVPIPEPSASEQPASEEPASPEPAEPEPTPASNFRLPPRAAEPDLFHPDPPESEPSAPAPVGDAPHAEAPHATLSRYSVPLRTKPEFHLPSISIPPRVWRMCALGLGLLAVLVLLGFGLRVLYRATTEPADMRPTAEETLGQKATTPAVATPENAKPAPSAPVAQPAATPAAPRTVQKIPPLYFD